jgi:hypothetical protein
MPLTCWHSEREVCQTITAPDRLAVHGRKSSPLALATISLFDPGHFAHRRRPAVLFAPHSRPRESSAAEPFQFVSTLMQPDGAHLNDA